MSDLYETRMSRRKAAAQKPAARAPGPDIAALAAGARPTAEQMGSRVDLPEGIREKMESSFGADFSNVKLFESQTVADAGAQAVTQGTNIAFAPGKLDLTSTSGQALLGHELSHVVSQARGESAGSGFLKDAALEAQADRQGQLAAQGESVYSGPVSPVSLGSASAASGPMQAKKLSKEEKQLRKDISEATKQRKVDFHFKSRMDDPFGTIQQKFTSTPRMPKQIRNAWKETREVGELNQAMDPEILENHLNSLFISLAGADQTDVMELPRVPAEGETITPAAFLDAAYTDKFKGARTSALRNEIRGSADAEDPETSPLRKYEELLSSMGPAQMGTRRRAKGVTEAQMLANENKDEERFLNGDDY